MLRVVPRVSASRHKPPLGDLKRLAEESEHAIRRCASSKALSNEYRRIRTQLERLNREQRWATVEEFATEVPSLAGLELISSLDSMVGATDRFRLPDDPADRLVAALRQLAAWATGIRLAYETLE
jgi:hypothetical protein